MEADRLREQLREEAGRAAACLEVARVAALLVLPKLVDLSGDLGEGVWGVTLPGAGIESVTRRPDGAVVCATRAGSSGWATPSTPPLTPRPERRTARRLLAVIIAKGRRADAGGLTLDGLAHVGRATHHMPTTRLGEMSRPPARPGGSHYSASDAGEKIVMG
ncbi:hypothetical protein [Nonomuraea wenchangensis]|uniref:hypothetical protein n=1 Tax=Nonomuraea wenchangensis TaxID=568860 RepID=UPI000B8A5607|nr:hypothetical protein [Nonomuraea wenchangensis]